MLTLTVKTQSHEETRRVAETLGRAMRGGEVLALCGDLGAGKTTFVQGLAAGMGVRSRVTSPTFILINEYCAENGLRLVHVDAYRLAEQATLADAVTFGLTDLLAGVDGDERTVLAIEWADRIASLLPDDLLHIELRIDPEEPDARTIHLAATGGQSAEALHRLSVA
ncbi:MAG: tRNA (adenosine(37)-N6)-threonylcarbamoyltransferase complex ATPase subunit type 1 TsaE [Caldilinea sp.]|nr:tRNA (adenosine(37)-N6)-threonylcarbamoyltransferase complex ATPase subunit type 1 TsaE [Caldilinea sp.]MDW8438878.1 tRNA (adenosine(37)-N6)-threonylcarbamoyltransferase complex ATPase subunit type 1 TsaE [Caldilineaceae bacterium]